MIFAICRKMGNCINFKELFPSSISAIIFSLYMGLFVCQGIFVTMSQKSNDHYDYSISQAVLLTELIKLIICFTYYSWKESLVSFYAESRQHFRLLWLYFIPAALYCLYNYLSYVNLLNYDPATYFILMQLRVVITGVLFQILFKKSLTFYQWTSLILLTVGCMVKNINIIRSPITENELINTFNVTSVNLNNKNNHKHNGMGLNVSTCLIMIQMLCSCFAGVYSEYLLKKDGLKVNMFIQNSFLYIDSIICNCLSLIFQTNSNVFSIEAFKAVSHPKVAIVILNNAICGIVTSFFLRYLNSILKNIASALELVFITVSSWLIFDIPITFETVVSIIIVSLAIIMYSHNPVKNLPENDIQYKKCPNSEV